MDNYVEFEASCTAATDRALLLDLEGEEVWVPRSQVRNDSDIESAGDAGCVYITTWFAKKENLV